MTREKKENLDESRRTLGFDSMNWWPRIVFEWRGVKNKIVFRWVSEFMILKRVQRSSFILRDRREGSSKRESLTEYGSVYRLGKDLEKRRWTFSSILISRVVWGGPNGRSIFENWADVG